MKIVPSDLRGRLLSGVAPSCQHRLFTQAWPSPVAARFPVTERTG